MAKNHTGRAKKHHDLSPVSLTVSSPKFEAPTLTVGQIAERLCKLNPDKAATKERVRHWTREDLLAPVAKHHEGTGRHRGYAEDSVYDAAVLSVIANAGLHITAHRYLLRGLPLVRQALQKWEAAKRGGRLFLEISHTEAGSPTITIHEGTVTPNPTARLSMLLNLTQIFSEVC